MARSAGSLIAVLFFAVLVVACAGASVPTVAPTAAPTPVPTAVPSAVPAPTPTVTPTPTPVPTFSFTDAEAERTARRWIADNEDLVRTEIGRAIAAHSDAVVDFSVGMKAQVASAGKEWKGGQVDSRIVWTGVRFVLPPGDAGRWELTLTSESVTDLEHEGIEGQLKAVIPFKIYGLYEKVEGYEVQLDAVMLGLEGITANVDLNQKLLDKGDVDSAIEGLLGN